MSSRLTAALVLLAYPGSDARKADCQFYILTRPNPALDAKYTVFGSVINGLDVVEKIQVADVLKRAYVREEPAIP